MTNANDNANDNANAHGIYAKRDLVDLTDAVTYSLNDYREERTAENRANLQRVTSILASVLDTPRVKEWGPHVARKLAEEAQSELNTPERDLIAVKKELAATLNAKVFPMGTFDFHGDHVHFAPSFSPASTAHVAAIIEGETEDQARSRADSVAYTMRQVFECSETSRTVYEERDSILGWWAIVWFNDPALGTSGNHAPCMGRAN